MERFYSKVNPMVHNRNLLKDSIILEEKAEAYQLKKALRLKENDIRIKAVRANMSENYELVELPRRQRFV